MATEFIEDDQLEDEDEENEDRGDQLEDEDEDSEEEVVEEDSEDEEDEEIEEGKPTGIPKFRFDEVIQQREEARERNLWLEAQLEKLIGQSNKQDEKVTEVVASSYDFEKAEEEYISLLVEGDIAKASKLRNEINREQRLDMMNIIKGIESTVSTKAKSESVALLENDRFDSFINSVEAKHPFLDSKHKSYNEEAVDTVNTLLAGYVASGKTKTEGLRLAVNKVAPLYTKEVDSKQSLGNKRTVEAGKKAAKAAATQPARVKSSTTTKSVDNSDVNVEKISEKDFSKLTAKEKSILRGD